MPELPEIEHLKRTLQPHLLGAEVVSARIHRADVVRVTPALADPRTPRRRPSLTGCHIRALRRHGKQLAILTREAK